MLKCTTLAAMDDPAAAGQYLMDRFLPILAEFWVDRGADWYHAETFSPAMAGGLFSMLTSRSLILVMAEDSESPGELRGFILGGLLRSLLSDTGHLHVEAWYGRTPEVEEGMLE